MTTASAETTGLRATSARSHDGTTKPLIAVVGATGVGKSDVAVAVATRLLAQGIPAEIVGADAMQLYRGMDIGTAKLSLAERRDVPHHLIDVLDVTDEATVAWYQPQARAAVEGIRSRGGVPILAGGSGLYVSSVVYDFAFPARDADVRARLEAEQRTSGTAPLLARLRELDPATAARVDPANPRRVIRALEIAELAEKGHGAALPKRPVPWTESIVVGLHVPRERLVARLDARVERMWRAGLVEEARGLLRVGLQRGVTASRAIGYAQAVAQLNGELSEESAIAETQRLTRRYARRQVSWFKRYPDLEWLDADGDDADEIVDRVTQETLDRLSR